MNEQTNHIWVSNYEIHKEARLDINEFLMRILPVEGIRAQWRPRFSFYPTSKEEMDINLMLWDYLNQDRNALNQDYFIFNLAYPKPLYFFLKHSERENISNVISLGLAGNYIVNKTHRDLIESQVYKPIMIKAFEVINKYFAEYIKVPEPDLDDEYGLPAGTYRRFWQKFRNSFDQAFKDLIKNSIIFPFIDPFDPHTKYNLAILERNEFDISLPCGYMTENDWERIVIRDKIDDLVRVETKLEYLQNWMEDLTLYHDNIRPELL